MLRGSVSSRAFADSHSLAVDGVDGVALPSALPLRPLSFDLRDALLLRPPLLSRPPGLLARLPPPPLPALERASTESVTLREP